ncbi:MAG: Gldg family protein [Verrucomicrobiota bacterium]
MSETKSNEEKGKRNYRGAAWTTALGILIVIGIVVAVNVIAGFLNLRMDFTEDKIYTLSKGTKKILSELDTPVTIRYYVSADKSIQPADVQTMAPRVENFLMEYKKGSNGMVRVKKILVKPDSDEEDSANLDGIRPQGQVFSAEDPLYFGLAVQCLDQTESIPFIHPARETLLEYDVSRAITQVVNPELPKVAVMTSMQVAGGFGGAGGMMNFQQPPEQPWIFYRELSQDYQLEVLAPDVTEIPEDVKVLLVVHPFDVTQEGEKAIDQYLLKGGNVVAMVDPMFFHAQLLTPPQQNPMAPPQGGPAPSSTFERLFEAWGLEFDPGQVLADNRFRSPVGRGVVHPAVLTLTEDAISEEDVTTAQLQDVRMAMAGGFKGQPAEGLTMDVLLASSPESQFVTPGEAELGPGVQRLVEEFAPSGEVIPIAVRLHGKFKTAFPPEGDAGEKSDEEGAAVQGEGGNESDGDGGGGEGSVADGDAEEAGDESKKPLVEATGEGTLVLFSDVDFLFDRMVAQEQNILGQRVMIPLNQNLSLLQNIVEQLAGDEDLIAVRSRSSTRRPFTRINEIEAAAESQFQDKIKELEKEVQDAQTRLANLQGEKDASQQFVLSPEQQDVIENLNVLVADKNKELRQVRKDLRKDIDRLIAVFKGVNVFTIPIFVGLIGIAFALVRASKRAAR